MQVPDDVEAAILRGPSKRLIVVSPRIVRRQAEARVQVLDDGEVALREAHRSVSLSVVISPTQVRELAV